MKRQKKILGIVISAIMLLTMIPLQSFGAVLPFTDVPTDAWYYDDVQKAWETGLINGMDATTFAPEENMTYAQAVKLAACMNQTYTTGSVILTNGSSNWWDSYVAYAKSGNIISKNYEWNAPATRAGYVEIFANALPDVALKAKNSIADGGIPDVSMSHPQAAAIYKLYRAGILTGNDEIGTFDPNRNIKRSEVSAILTRMMNEDARKDLNLSSVTSPHDSEVQGGTITDNWSQIIASVNDGSYKIKYKIGDTKALDLGSEGVVDMQIAAFDADELADGSGKAAITWISKQVLKTEHRMNPSREYNSDTTGYVLGTGSIGGWEWSEMRTWLKNDIKPLIPSAVRNEIKYVKKYSSSYNIFLDYTQNAVTTDDVWIPSYREVFGSNSTYESAGPMYSDLFASKTDRIKQKTDAFSASWWLRSAYNRIGRNFLIVDAGGKIINAANVNAVALGFCL